MGFVFKTTFWLGLVYWAMPFDGGSRKPAMFSPAEEAAFCIRARDAVVARVGPAAEAYRSLATLGCAAVVVPAAVAVAAPASPSSPVGPVEADNRRVPLPPPRPRPG